MKQNPPFTASDSAPHPPAQPFFSFSSFYVSRFVRPGVTEEEEQSSGAGCHLHPSDWQGPPVTRVTSK